MKKLIIKSKWLVLLVFLLICVSDSTVLGKKNNEIAGSIDDLALQIVKSMVQAKIGKIAVLPFKDLNGNVNNLGLFLAEELTTRIFLEKQFDVVERQLLDQVLNELALNESAIIEQETAKQIGKLLGVDAILTGTATEVEDFVVINARLIGTENGKILAVARTQMDSTPSIKNLLNTHPAPKTTKISSVPPVPPKAPEQTPPPTQPGVPAEPEPQVQNLQNTMPKQQDHMVLVPAGEFQMGSNFGYQECKRVQQNCETRLFEDESPSHRVYLDAYLIDIYEVTNREYDECVSKGVCTSKAIHPGFTDPNFPIVGVTWYQAKAYCEWKGERLPTEAEWEKAAKGNDSRMYPWGGKINCNLANYANCGLNRIQDASSYLAGKGPFGTFNMSGNVREWVMDWYDENYYGSSPSSNPKGPDQGKYKALRGGAYNSEAALVRTSARTKRTPDGEWDTSGFRCVKSP